MANKIPPSYTRQHNQWGIPFSTVENTISKGKVAPSQRNVTEAIYYDLENNVSVVVNSETRNVITVSFGKLE
jgi:hypothetical protein